MVALFGAILLFTPLTTRANKEQSKIREQKTGEVPADAPPAVQLPALITYTFTSTETKVLPGLSTEAGSKYNCKGNFADEDKIGRLVIVALLYQSGCWTDGRYNYSDYKVEQGQLVGSNKVQFTAYKVYPPAKLATQFLGSHHALYYQFPTKADYTVYTFDGQSIKKVLEIGAAQIDPKQYTKLATLTISENKTPLIYIFTPSRQPLTAYTQLAPGVAGAQLSQTDLGTLDKYRFVIQGAPFDTTRDYTAGPAAWENIYSHTRQFFSVQLANQIGVIWQDQTSHTLQLTKLSAALQAQQTVALPNSRNERLAAATSDDGVTLYYLTIQGGGKDQNTDRSATLYKVDSQGKLLLQAQLDTSPTPPIGTSRDALDISLFEGYVADMRYANGLLGVMLGRRLHRREDGLQHQSGVALVYNAATLKLQKNLGQTSGHSFENVLTTNQAGQFVGIDLGDNYPRGVNLHKFDGAQIKSKVVYTFKTEHGKTAQNPAGITYPPYREISNNGVTYYQWSNDNQTYTELGGVMEGQQGYTIVFASETGPGGKALLNNLVGNPLNAPRNIGLVQVKPDFEKQANFVLSQGITETGGYYTFGGKWSPQLNSGIIWLTNYQHKNQENVSRLKTVKLPDGNLLLLWEKWSADSYVNTYGMKITERGVKLTEPIALGPEVRLDRRDDPLVSGNKVYWVGGDKVEQQLVLIVLQVNG